MRVRAESGKVVLERPGRGGWGAPAAEPFETLTPQEARAFVTELERAIAAASPECTDLTAAWCPVHGDCTCGPDGPSDDLSCPLHSPTGRHPDGV